MKTKLCLMCVLLCSVLIDTACSSEPRPSQTVRRYWELLERRDKELLNLYSRVRVQAQGISQLKQLMEMNAGRIQASGGIKSIEILKEDVAGEIAEVTAKITVNKAGARGEDSMKVEYKLVKEDAAWKIHDIQ